MQSLWSLYMHFTIIVNYEFNCCLSRILVRLLYPTTQYNPFCSCNLKCGFVTLKRFDWPGKWSQVDMCGPLMALSCHFEKSTLFGEKNCLGHHSVLRIFHHLKLHPWKIQIVQQLKPNDYKLDQEFCEQLLAKTNVDANFIDNFLMSDEAHFHLNGCVNNQKFLFYSAWETPAQLPQNPLQSAKVTV